MSDTGPFGIHRGYTPMSETEREVVSRLYEAGDLRVHIVGWGIVNQPRVIIGDLRVSLHFRLDFTAPAAPVDVHFFDMELRTGTGLLLFKERQSVMYYGKPVQVCSGVFFDMVWDIAIRSMDPKLVKAIKPGALGLTSRFMDKDTKEFTTVGNLSLNSRDRAQLEKVRKGEGDNKVDTLKKAVKAVKGQAAALAEGRVKVKK